MENFNQYQYDDLLNREADVYANTKYQIILKFLAGRSGLKILNAGCGSGELSFLLAAAGHTVVGIDLAPEYIALAEKHTPEHLRSRCSFRVSSIEDFGNTEKFDCVIATDVLEHIADDLTAAKKLTDLIAERGSVIVTVPALPALFGYHDELLGHFRRYTKASLGTLMLGVGNITFKKLRYFGFTLIPVCYLFSKVWRKPYPVASSGKGLGSFIRQLILGSMLTFDRFITMPLGTSLIFWGKKKHL